MEEEIKVKKIEFSDRIFWLLLFFVISFIAFLAVNVIYKFFSTDFFHEIKVSGEAKVFVKPDVAVLNLGVKTEGKELQSVVKDNIEKMNLVLKEIKDLGIEEKYIQTISYDLSPYYEWKTGGEKVFKGYVLDQQIRVKIRDFEKIGDVIEVSTERGANLVGNLYFIVDDIELAKAQAREEAIKKAKEKAESIARQAGFKLKKIIDVYENPYFYPLAGRSGFYSGDNIAFAPSQSIDISPEIKAGEIEVKVDVGLVYRIR